LQTKMPYAILVTPTRAPYPTQLILPHAVTLLIFSEEFHISFLHPPVTTYTKCLNMFLDGLSLKYCQSSALYSK
jgi:hypothetical protein